VSDRPAAAPVLPDFLAVAEVAASLSLSPKTVRRLVLDGDLPAVKVAGRLRIDRAGVEAYLDGCRVVPASHPSAAVVERPSRRGRPGALAAAFDRLDVLDGDRGGA